MTRHFTSIFGGLPSQLKGLGGLKLFALAVFMLALASHLPQYTKYTFCTAAIIDCTKP